LSGQGGLLRQVVIKTHSSFFSCGITEWIHRYRRKNFCGKGGEPLFNGELWRELDELVRDLNKMGVMVRFWHVTRRENIRAIELARRALQQGAGKD
jgi:ribonuclease HI